MGMTYKHVIFEQEDEIGIIYLDRQEALNAMNAEMTSDLRQCFESIQKNSRLRVIILTGKGKAFSAGGDLDMFDEIEFPADGRIVSQTSQDMIDKLEHLRQPSIAAVNGYALGGGLELALGCSMRFASSEAKLGFPELKVGLMPGAGGTQRLIRTVGKAKAMELILTGKQITAQNAKEIGLVNDVFPPEELFSKVKENARAILENGPLAVELVKCVLDKSLDIPFHIGLSLEAESFGLVSSSEDRHEGIRAFHEKRRPIFKGQ